MNVIFLNVKKHFSNTKLRKPSKKLKKTLFYYNIIFLLEKIRFKDYRE